MGRTKEQFSKLMNLAESAGMVCVGKEKDDYVFCSKDSAYEVMEQQNEDSETITGKVRLIDREEYEAMKQQDGDSETVSSILQLIDGELRMDLSEVERSKLNGLPKEFNAVLTMEIPDEWVEEWMHEMATENKKTLPIIIKNQLPRKKPVPEYIEKELDEMPPGYIKSDRRTLETTVENFIEYFLVGEKNFNTGILLNFRKQDGSEIMPKGAQQAIARVKERLRKKS